MIRNETPSCFYAVKRRDCPNLQGLGQSTPIQSRLLHNPIFCLINQLKSVRKPVLRSVKPRLPPWFSVKREFIEDPWGPPFVACRSRRKASPSSYSFSCKVRTAQASELTTQWDLRGLPETGRKLRCAHYSGSIKREGCCSQRETLV